MRGLQRGIAAATSKRHRNDAATSRIWLMDPPEAARSRPRGRFMNHLSTLLTGVATVAIAVTAPAAAQTAEPAQPLAYALQSIPAAHIAARTAAPLPARGPPTL